jgi:hypothetical protein
VAALAAIGLVESYNEELALGGRDLPVVVGSIHRDFECSRGLGDSSSRRDGGEDNQRNDAVAKKLEYCSLGPVSL